MTLIKPILAAAALLGSAGVAAAQSAPGAGVYAGASVDALEFDAYTLSGRLGYNFNENFGVEGQAGFGIIDDEQEDFGVEAELGVDYLVGAFGVARVPVARDIEVFGRAGYYFSQFGVEATDGVTTVEGEADVDGFAVGLGGQYNFGLNGQNAIRLEYTYLDADDVDVDGESFEGGGGLDVFSLGFIRRF